MQFNWRPGSAWTNGVNRRRGQSQELASLQMGATDSERQKYGKYYLCQYLGDLHYNK